MKPQSRSIQRQALVLAIGVALSGNGSRAATITVNSNDDNAASTFCNLRGAVASINAAAATPACSATTTGAFGSNDTIVFGPLANSVVTLSQGQLIVTKPMTITGSGQTIDAAGQSTALYVQYSDLTLGDLAIINGFDSSVAGGIITIGGTLTLNRVEMSNNHGYNGGAIEAFQSAAATNVVLNDSHLHANYAHSGGAVFIQNATVTLSGTMIDANTASSTGGAIAVDGGSFSASDSILAGNGAPSGGAISTQGYTLLNRTIVSGNSATTNGGAIDSTGSAATIVVIDSTISGGSAANGGAIAASVGGTVTLTNSTLASNAATGLGGAVYGKKYPHVTLTNATISGNSAANGGAMYFKKDGSYGNTVLTFANSIVSANSAPGGKDMGGTFTMLTGNNNLFGSALDIPPYNASGNANVFSDAPGLGPLQNNGGFTNTCALLAGSPAIDAGSNPSASALTTDQRGAGFVRIANGTVDIGAYEFLADRIFANGFEQVP